MNYDLSRLHPLDFETLVQSICKKIIGNGCTSFGKGPDGGREATFDGTAPYPSLSEQWSGYWVVQAKFKTELSSNLDKDFSWLKQQLGAEMDKFATRAEEFSLPDNYLLFTNVRLSSVANTGGQDKAKALSKKYQKDYKIKNIKIISYDDIFDYLTLFRDLAIAYAPFILPGDILHAMLEMLNEKGDRNQLIRETVHRYLEIEFREDLQSKLDQAGKLTSNKVMLEKVFIDLSVQQEHATGEPKLFIGNMLQIGNRIMRWSEDPSRGRYVLKAGPGQGKSTLTQFLAQICRAYFLKSNDQNTMAAPGLDYFIADLKSSIEVEPLWTRLPFKIILKDYAAWISETRIRSKDEPIAVLNYLRQMIRKKTGSDYLSIQELELLVQRIPCLFIFDGLDEVPMSSNRAEVITELIQFNDVIVRRLDIDAIIIATTRPQGYSAEFDPAHYRHLNIIDLDTETCEIYITRLLENTVDDISTRENRLQILQKALIDPQISRIMKSPLQASIMVILVNSGGDPPTNKFDLFKQYFDTIFSRERQRNISKILSTQGKYIIDIHYRLGLYLQRVSEKSTNPAANITLYEFEQIVKSYLTEKDIEEAEVVSYIEEIRKASIDRLVFISQVEDEKVGFAIRSLQEYFAANGYIHNVWDDEIKSRIAAISINSYWSNTLLFVIGYLAQNKYYLIDSVDSICQNLNGKDLDPGKVSLTSACLLGSWLALDILTEEIFRDDPKMENRFCQFLEPLLTLPHIEKHREFSRLSEKTLEKWVIPSLKKQIVVESNINCWKLAVILIKAGKADLNDFLLLLPANPHLKLRRIQSIIEEDLITQGLVESFCKDILDYNKIDLLKLFRQNSYSHFLSEVCQVVSGEAKIRVWDMIVLSTLVDVNDNHAPYNLLADIGFLETDKRGQTSIIGRDVSERQIVLVSGFYYLITRCQLKNTSLVPDFKAFSLKLGSKLANLIADFLLTLSFESYLKLKNHIDTLESQFGQKVRDVLAKIDSATQKIFLSNSITREQFDYERKHLDSLFNLDQENANEVLDNYTYQTECYLVLDDFHDRIEQFADRFMPLARPETDDLLASIVSLSSLHVDIEVLRSLVKRSGIVDAIERGFLIAQKRRIGNFHFNIYDYVYIFDAARIVRLLDAYPALYHNKITFDAQRSEIKKSIVPITDSLILLRQVLRIQQMAGKRPAYKMLFQILLYQIRVFHILDQDLIPIPDIMEDKENMDPFRALLLLLDDGFNEKHLEVVSAVFLSDEKMHQDMEFQLCLLEVLKLAKNGLFTDQILLLLMIHFHDAYTSNGNLISFIKSYVGNKATEIERVLSVNPS